MVTPISRVGLGYWDWLLFGSVGGYEGDDGGVGSVQIHIGKTVGKARGRAKAELLWLVEP